MIIILLLSIVILGIIIVTKEETVTIPVETQSQQSSSINLELIDQASILNAMESEVEIVGLSGDVSKTVQYDDSNLLGKRELTMQVNGTYKLGYDLKEIVANPERVIVNNTDGIVTIIVPEIELISLELPYDEVVVQDKDGLLRKKISDDEKKSTYAEVKNRIIDDIYSDDELMDQAYNNTNKALKEILLLADGVNDVKFVKQ